MAYRGRYIPSKPQKYKGDSSNIIYRSLWERKFMVYCDRNDNILEWGSEEIIIPYRSPLDFPVLSSRRPVPWSNLRRSSDRISGLASTLVMRWPRPSQVTAVLHRDPLRPVLWPLVRTLPPSR